MTIRLGRRLSPRLCALAVLPGGCAILAALAPLPALAREEQLHVRFGAISTSYSGQGAGLKAGSFTVPTSLEGDYELFQTDRQSYFLRLSMAYEFGANIRDFYVGGGVRFYPFSKGSSYEVNTPEFSLRAVPTSRFFFGLDVGIGQVIVREPSDTLQTVTQTLNLGAHAGYVYGVTERLGLELVAGAGYGYGFSTVGLSTITKRVMAGISYLF